MAFSYDFIIPENLQVIDDANQRDLVELDEVFKDTENTHFVLFFEGGRTNNLAVLSMHEHLANAIKNIENKND